MSPVISYSALVVTKMGIWGESWSEDWLFDAAHIRGIKIVSSCILDEVLIWPSLTPSESINDTYHKPNLAFYIFSVALLAYLSSPQDVICIHLGRWQVSTDQLVTYALCHVILSWLFISITSELWDMQVEWNLSIKAVRYHIHLNRCPVAIWDAHVKDMGWAIPKPSKA